MHTTDVKVKVNFLNDVQYLLTANIEVVMLLHSIR